eukprot:s103_g13.t3
MEKATLIDAQRKLKDFIKKTRAAITSLEGKLEELRYDIQQKSQALSVDELCLRTTSRSLETVSERSTFLRQGASSGCSGSRNLPSKIRGGAQLARHEVASQEGSRNEILRQQEALRLNQSAIHREQAAKELREEASKLIQRVARAAEDATAKTDKSMKDRVNENQQMRRRLESELRETCNQINVTKNTIQDTKTQIRSLEEPMELTSTCASWRQQRASREKTQDPVSSTLQQHQMILLRCHEDLRQHHQNEKNILQELQEKKEQLKEDLQDKTCALHIDLNCLTHEATCLNGKPSPAISRQRLPKAMKELLFNRRPFGEGQTQDAFRRQTAVEGTFDIVFPASPKVSAEAIKFLRRLLTRDRDQRPDVLEAIRDPYIRKTWTDQSARARK